MKCPRCTTELSSVIIEESAVMACPNCEGAWYPGESLGEVTDQTFSQLKETGLAATMVPDKLARVDLDQPVACPECGEKMARFSYSMTCPIVLDECPAHGVWLDDGELGTLMQYLTELDKRVGAQSEVLLSERNLKTLQELGKSPASYSLPANVLATLSSVYSRPR